ncbi:MAG: MbnP family copper-binding protein [Woeseiaceae bacterium]
MYSRFGIVFLLATVLAACGEQELRVQIPFGAVYKGAKIDCESEGGPQLSDLRFYASEIELIDAAGDSYAIKLDSDSIWQHADVVLLDLENGSGGCANGTIDINSEIRGSVADRDYRSLQFTLGVPFELNHRDPLLAEAPLDDAAMHWHWRGGYKFLRAGLRNANDSFWIHLGSTGCQGTIQDITHCNAPNRVSVQIDDFVPGRDVVIIDLAEIPGVDELADGDASDCSSGPAESSCINAFAAFGLDHATGKTNSEQRVFTRYPLR